MSKTIQNTIHIQASWGLFIGLFDDNVLHKHYALQISIASHQKFTITDAHNIQTTFNACYINSNVPHQFKCSQTSFILLINPISSVGHQLCNSYKGTSVSGLDEKLKPLSDAFHTYLSDEISFAGFTEYIDTILTDFKCQCELENHVEDERIYKAIQYLEKNFDRNVSLKEIAGYCFLSETRFLHLFKEKTNLNFRRYQIWNKLIKSLPFLATQSITETAHQFGFTDSSHYNRTFKETFGLTPKFLSQLK